MSLTSAVRSPRTPIRQFLDRELSAGSRPLRATYRAAIPTRRVLLPTPGVGHEAGTVGTAIDLRLRLSFAGPAVDEAFLLGVAHCENVARRLPDLPSTQTWKVLAARGRELVEAIGDHITSLAFEDRLQELTRTHDEEARLARMLLVASWYSLNIRNAFAFPETPLFKAVRSAPQEFSLERVLAIPDDALVQDVLQQVFAAEDSLLDALRRQTTSAQCRGGPTFSGSADVAADADLIADGLLIDFKSTRRVEHLPQATVHQLLGYVLLDYEDEHQIDRVGIYLTRAAALVTWPIEDYLDLLGARRRDLKDLRAAFQELLQQDEWYADETSLPPHIDDVDRVLEEVAARIPDGCCPVCAQPMLPLRRSYVCSDWCANRSDYMKRRGWLPTQRLGS